MNLLPKRYQHNQNHKKHLSLEVKKSGLKEIIYYKQALQETRKLRCKKRE
jgi:hypothetical protein